MKQYLDLLQFILDNGVDKEDRTGTGTRSIFGHQMRFDLADGFPLVTTKRVFTKAVVHELLWFIAGDTNIKYLTDNGVTIWNEWADENGDLGPVYGKQWRSWPQNASGIVRENDAVTLLVPPAIDQLDNVIASLINNPDSRRHIVSAWNPAEVDDMALPPCHCLFQFNSRPLGLGERYAIFGDRQGGCDFELEGNEDHVTRIVDEASIPTRALDCQLYQRSADVFLGVPFNIASYALLTHMIAQVTGHAPGHFVHSFGDVHIYRNHMDQVREQLSREPRPLPTLVLNRQVKKIDLFRFEDVEFHAYNPHPAIRAEVAV